MSPQNHLFMAGRRRLLAALRSTKGAIDLASIMVGVLVIGIIGGIIAATVFSVIPWSQDEAAKGALDSVADAQAVYFAGGDDVTSYSAAVTGGMTLTSFSASSDKGRYLDFAGLVEKKLIADSATVTVLVNPDRTCFVSLSASSTSRVFFGTNTGPSVDEYDAARSGTDYCMSDAAIGEAIQDILLGRTGSGDPGTPTTPGTGTGVGTGSGGTTPTDTDTDTDTDPTPTPTPTPTTPAQPVVKGFGPSCMPNQFCITPGKVIRYDDGSPQATCLNFTGPMPQAYPHGSIESNFLEGRRADGGWDQFALRGGPNFSNYAAGACGAKDTPADLQVAAVNLYDYSALRFYNTPGSDSVQTY